MLNDSGQALLEVTIASGLAIVVIAAITVTTIIGLRNSQYAQNQIQATKYAQEGLEQVRAIKDRNCAVQDGSGNTYLWQDATTNPLQVWGHDFSSTPNFVVDINPSSVPSRCELSAGGAEMLLGGRFNRKIILAQTIDRNPGKIKVTCQVDWTDYAGTHQSQLVTILSQD